MDVRPQNIDVHIDQIVLDGFQHVDQAFLAAAIQRELSRLVARSHLPRSWNEDSRIPGIDSGAGSLKPADGADPIGTQIAQAIHKGLSQ